MHRAAAMLGGWATLVESSVEASAVFLQWLPDGSLGVISSGQGGVLAARCQRLNSGSSGMGLMNRAFPLTGCSEAEADIGKGTWGPYYSGMVSPLVEHAKRWIKASWREVGSHFQAGPLPVVQFEDMDADDLAHPFKHRGLAFWVLDAGELIEVDEFSIQAVPYIAFSLVPDQDRMNIQTQWASRCGYGFRVQFDAAGAVIEQHVRWVS